MPGRGGAHRRPIQLSAGWLDGPQIATNGHVWLRGLTFRNYASLDSGQAAVRAVDGWQIEHCFFDSPGRDGLDLRGDDILLTRTTIQDAFNHAYIGWGPANGATSPTDPRFEGSRNLRILDNVWRRNYATTMSTGGGSAVVKVMGSKGALVENNEAYNNRGPGFWFDAANHDYIVRHNYFHDQINLGAGHSASAGLHIEISWAPGLVEHNVFANNAHEGVGIDNSAGVTVRDNLFYGNRRGIVLSNFDRGAAFPLKGVQIEANQFKDWREYRRDRAAREHRRLFWPLRTSSRTQTSISRSAAAGSRVGGAARLARSALSTGCGRRWGGSSTGGLRRLHGRRKGNVPDDDGSRNVQRSWTH